MAQRPDSIRVVTLLYVLELSENGSLCDAGFAELRVEMEKYIGEVMQVRDADLQQTRDQILKCFGKVDCFLLPHPGQGIAWRYL